MKKMSALLLCCVSALSVSAQITITNATFPTAGDTLKTANDFTVEGITMDPPGGPYTWDYSSLSAESRQVQVFEPAANGAAAASFPGAELVVINPEGGEIYYDVTATQFANLGFSGGEITEGFPFVTELLFSPPLVERRAPANFFDIHQQSSNLIFAASLEDLPAGVLDSFGIPTGLLDSIRFRINFESLNVINAHGTLTIPGGTYAVLREQSTVYSTTSLDVHNSLLGWIDVGSLGAPIDGLGTDTTTTYSFLSNTEKEPIAVMTMSEPNSLVASQAVFKDNGIPNAVHNVAAIQLAATIAPNPFTDLFTISFAQVPADRYTLVVYDMLGLPVLRQDLHDKSTQVSFASHASGIYNYHVLNADQLIVATGTLCRQ